MEHHANIVPWLMLAEEVGLEVRYLPVDGEGYLNLDELNTLVDGVKLVGISAMSNVLGTINPVARIAEAAHAAGAVVVVDGAQLGAPRARQRELRSAPTFWPSPATR